MNACALLGSYMCTYNGGNWFKFYIEDNAVYGLMFA